jgi:hypothetical protein
LDLEEGCVVWGIKNCPDDGIIVAGNCVMDSGGWWPFLFKTNSLGQMEWSKLYTQNTNRVAEFFDVQILFNGFIMSWEPEFVAPNCQMGMLKTDVLGNIQWSKLYLQNKRSFPFSAIQTIGREYTLVGRAYDVVSPSVSAIAIVKTDRFGIAKCNDSVLTITPVQLNCTMSSPGVINAGFLSSSISPIATSVIFTEYDVCESILETSFTNEKEDGITLFPNPVHSILCIKGEFNRFRLKMSITDVFGKDVPCEFEITGEGPFMVVACDISALESGVYFLKIENDKKAILKKFAIQ